MAGMVCWFRNVSRTIAAHSYFQIVLRVLKVFHDTQENSEVASKTATVSISYAIYSFSDFKIVAIGFLLVGYMLESGLGFTQIFMIMWPVSMFFYAFLVLLSDWTKVDFTLAKGSRRIINELLGESKALGITVEVLLGLSQVVWTGMAQFYLLFRERFNSRLISYAVFIILSAVQMYIWVHIYITGIDVIKYFWHLLSG